MRHVLAEDVALKSVSNVQWLSHVASLLGCLSMAAGLLACGDDERWDPRDRDRPHDPSDAGNVPDASDDAGQMPDAATDAGDPPLSFGGLTVTVTPEEQVLDLFGHAGHRFWFEVSNDQLAALNSNQGGFPGEGDIYTPGSGDGGVANYADHVLVQDVVTQSVADYGKVEVALVGESTFRQWDQGHIPNVRVDTNEFEKGKRIGSFEHMRFNNALVGSIFREGLAHQIYRALDYPALRSTHAFLGSSVWGEDVWVPMTLMEMYKRRFCRDNEALIGGTCENMWEFPGDLGNGGGGGFPIPIDKLPGPGPDPAPGDGDDRVPAEWCQVSECDNTRLIEVMDVLAATAQAPGFKDALDAYIDWDRFHQFQCLSWIMWTGDDPIHNSNNNLIIERESDHKLIWAPYSVDISAGQDWYTNVSLTGSGSIASGCQRDPDCWADTIATCEDLIMRFDDLNPEEMVDVLVSELTDLEMMRYGDDERAEALREWFVWRQSVLADELEIFRYLPDDNGNCPMDLELCGDGGCGTTEQCAERICVFGEYWCESRSRCYNPQWDNCPNCDELMPVYCGWTSECVEHVDVCIAACESAQDYEWCYAQNECASIGGCYGGDDDAGVGGFGGGIGGFGGQF